jgi:hypothetical protein
MELAVMGPADRHDELIAHSAPQCARLREGEVMRVGRHTAAHEARLPQHESLVVLIAQANRFAQGVD